MPEAELFLSKSGGFDVKEGNKYANYTLTTVNCLETSLVQWNQYKYKTVIKAKCKDKPSESKMNSFIEKFDEHIPEYKIIRTPSGRPYVCWFNYQGQHPKRGKEGFPEPKIEHSKDYSEITLTYYGFAIRVSEAEASEWRAKLEE